MKQIILIAVLLTLALAIPNSPDYIPQSNQGHNLPRGVTELTGVDPTIPSDHDLFPFNSVARKAKILAIGESAHGVAGYQDLQFRLSKYLIKHFNYRRLLLEVLSDDRALNHYLTTGEGDLGEIIYLNPWHGDDSEMKDFFQWLRDWNVENPTKTVLVFCVDPQSPWLNRPVISAFLEAYNASIEASYTEIINQNCFGAKFNNQVEWAYSPETSAYYSTGTLPEEETDACFAVLDELKDLLEDNKQEIISSLGYITYYNTIDAIRSLGAWVEKSILLFFHTAEALTVREDAFAKSVLWKWKRECKKAIFIAHHLHISKDVILNTSLGADDWTGFSPVGAIVKGEIGKKYRAIANSGYNIKAMFSGQYPLPDSSESIDFTFKAYEKPWLVLRTRAHWVRATRGGDWLVHEEGIPNGRYYNLPTAFDRVVFHYNASAGVFLNGN